MAEAVLEEIYESELSSSEVDELRSVLEDVLLSSGKFTLKQISEWLGGFDACEIDEHRYSLIEYAHTFAESGEEQETRSVDILETKLLSDKEKAELFTKIQQMDFVEGGIFLDYIEGLLQKAKELEKDKTALQKNRDLSVEQRTILIKEFENKKVDDREKMVKQLPTILAEFKRKNESERVIVRVQDLIASRKVTEAREVLNSGLALGIIMWDQYRMLEERVSGIEADEAREYLLAV